MCQGRQTIHSHHQVLDPRLAWEVFHPLLYAAEVEDQLCLGLGLVESLDHAVVHEE